MLQNIKITLMSSWGIFLFLLQFYLDKVILLEFCLSSDDQQGNKNP